MTTEKKIKYLFIAVIFLVVLNAATFISIIWHTKNAQEAQITETKAITTNTQVPSRPYRGRLGRGLGRGSFYNLMDSLRLSPEQREFFIQKHNLFIAKHRFMIDSLRLYNHLIDDELCKDNPDATILNRYAYRIGQLHYRFVIDNAMMFRDLKTVLDRRQQKILCDFVHNPRGFYRKTVRKKRIK